MQKIIIWLIIIGLIIAGVIWSYQRFGVEKKLPYELATVIRGDVIEEVSETGTVKTAEEIDLGFRNPGKIEKIWVEVGKKVKSGDILAKLETGQLKIQLSEAEASLELAQAKLNQLLAGTSEEEIKLAETAVSNAEVSLTSAKQNLEDIKAKATSDLNQAYEDALTTLDNSYLKLSNTFNTVSTIQRTYFTASDQEGLRVREKEDEIERAFNKVKPYIETAKSDSQESIDAALKEMKNALDVTAKALEVIRDTCEEPVYRNTVSSADKTSLDTERNNIDIALTNIVNSQQTIASTNLTNETNINTAQAKVDSAEGQLQSAKDTLAIKKAGPRQVDIDLYNAQIKQAQAKVDLLEEQIEESILKSPTSGQITKLNKRVGEIVQPMLAEALLTLSPAAPLQIKVDIYEEDVVKMKIGNPVNISLIAFPGKTFKGKVVAIDPAEKLIEGVVYYKATIDFEQIPEEVKPGMTADLTIITASKQNVLIVPEDAVQKKDKKTIVQVFKNGLIENKEIEIGLEGSNDLVEVISGLTEGEKVVLK